MPETQSGSSREGDPGGTKARADRRGEHRGSHAAPRSSTPPSGSLPRGGKLTSGSGVPARWSGGGRRCMAAAGKCPQVHGGVPGFTSRTPFRDGRRDPTGRGAVELALGGGCDSSDPRFVPCASRSPAVARRPPLPDGPRVRCSMDPNHVVGSRITRWPELQLAGSKTPPAPWPSGYAPILGKFAAFGEFLTRTELFRPADGVQGGRATLTPFFIQAVAKQWAAPGIARRGGGSGRMAVQSRRPGSARMAACSGAGLALLASGT